MRWTRWENSRATGLLCLAQVLGQQIHQEPVAPAARRVAFVAAHHADRPEPDALVAADRAGVRRRRVDDDAMVPALLDEPPCQSTDGVAAETPVVPVRVQRDVDARMAVVGFRLLPVTDHPDGLALVLDREPRVLA